MNNSKKLHRIQIDIDVEANSHRDAEIAVINSWCKNKSPIVGIRSSLVLEENEECCPTCYPTKRLPTLWLQYEEEEREVELMSSRATFASMLSDRY